MADSIYTERYMNTLPLNPDGYDNASIRNVSNFAKVDFLLAHGSGDDNGLSFMTDVTMCWTNTPLVHFANAAHLIDLFTEQKVRNYRFRMFTDRYVGLCGPWPVLISITAIIAS